MTEIPGTDERMILAFERIANALEAMVEIQEIAWGKIYPGGTTAAEIEAEARANPHTVRSGFMRAWVASQMALLQAQQEQARTQIGRMILQGNNGGRRQ